ncbi:probable 2-oxoglutarate dehydrogenase E1 component DHKTD1 homolog, mitochondrial isoform X1 [Euwallacea similis]|uniref:probable 2-oxoglutarate dehydrogenase E1 component DHKTD1 homolog, mitochondrial isoform X1 n=1 Tax=Euwallacea similis TaxID=1736056 RepID=UPI00344ECD00
MLHFNKLNLNYVLKLRLCLKMERNYQSDSVFGYRKVTRSQFKVPAHHLQNRSNNSNLYQLITAYRKYGHKYANTNSFISSPSKQQSELDLSRYGFNDLTQTFVMGEGLLQLPNNAISLNYILNFLNGTYCNFISAEFDYLESEEEREWFTFKMETLHSEEISNETKRRIVWLLVESQAFDEFLAKKFSSVKRYGGEGAETMMVFFDEVLQLAAKEPLEQLVVAMPHRGRLNLLTGVLNYHPAEIFHKLRGNKDFPDGYRCTGDVLSHIVSSTDISIYNKSLHVSVLRNPSHLEAVNPVSMGKTRAKQLMCKDGAYGNLNWGEKVMNIQVHGDAAFVGQGVNQETLAMSTVPHFEVGGTLHLIVNNQLGFTTPGDRGRSSRYCSDLAKMIAAPVVHVNGDHPEEVLKATRLAFAYQRLFRRDVVINLNCFRRRGHNEMDDPTFTNPKIYSVINSRRSVPDMYAEKLINEKTMSEQECLNICKEQVDFLNEELKNSEHWIPRDVYFHGHWTGFSQPNHAVTVWDSGVDVELLTFVGRNSVKYPQNFNIHPTVLRGHVTNRLSRIGEGARLDWSTAEALALGSLIFQGLNVRISGQDIGRGTFSQRHAMFVDQTTSNIFIPLNHMQTHQKAFLELANSILSEEAVLGFEYGMSLENPHNLIIWEAQFGDFFNGAQIIFDTFISSGEAKWIYQSGLVVLLPHGYDGAGPEHSSARIERFLQLSDSKEDKVDGDNVNMDICYPSTPAQYFHLLRRQMLRNFRKPLIVFTPKILLRAPECVSNFADMVKGTCFKPVLGDITINPPAVRRVILTSGKHYYSLVKARENARDNSTAIVRVECYCPFPTAELLLEIKKYPNAQSYIWCQEEPQNMGAWTFMKRRFENLLGRPLKYCGRPTQASPAVAVAFLHKQQEIEILTRPFVM